MAKILILDDAATNRAIYSRLAQAASSSAETHSFGHPDEALSWLATNVPDLIITDFRMPGMSGAQFTRVVRGMDAISDVPVIIVTASDERRYSVEALEAGASEFLRRPLDHTEFKIRVQNVLRMAVQAKQLRSRATSLERELKVSEEVRAGLVRHSKTALAEVIDTIPAAISVTDLEGRHVLSNKLFVEMVGEAASGGSGNDGAAGSGTDRAKREKLKNDLVLRLGSFLPPFEEELLSPSGELLVLLTTKAPLTGFDVSGTTSVLTTSIDITARKMAERHLDYAAHHDQMTRLPNRQMMMQEVTQAIARGGRGGVPFALHFVDLDAFKAINDSRGHSAGDAVLREIALRLQEHVSTMGLVARIGGDEFAVLQVGVHDTEEASSFAAGLVACIQPPTIIEGRQIRLSASVGTTLYPQDGDTFEVLLHNADVAMYSAKRIGRNQHALFVTSMIETVGWRLSMREDLLQAIALDTFELYYQPQIDLDSGRMVAVEALLRWPRPDGEHILPSVFLSVAEEYNMIADIDALVTRKACKQGAEWLAAGLPPIRLCVNISPVSFDAYDVAEMVSQALLASGMEPKNLEIEMTEQTLAANTEGAAAALSRLKQLDVQIAIDDFGTGYSSMSSLKDYPIDRLKIDRSFVTNVATNLADAIIVQTIIDLGRKMDLNVIAEGVETAEQLQFLFSAGCKDFQGYYFSKPLRPSDIPEAMRRTFTTPDRL